MATGDQQCFYGAGGGLSVTCKQGQDVYINIVETDTFSSVETGELKIPWDMIDLGFHGETFTFRINTESSGIWDRFWVGAIDFIGGICITDFVPGLKTSKLLKLGPKTVKKIKKLNRAINNFKRAQDKLETCSEYGVELCGDAADVLSTIWDAECYQPTLNGGTYEVHVQLSGSTLSTSSSLWLLASLCVSSLALSPL